MARPLSRGSGGAQPRRVEARALPPRAPPRGALRAPARLLRLKGIAWLATRHWQQAHAALAGTQFGLSPGPAWWAALPRDEWPEGLEEDIRPLWHEQHGDRSSELVCIGQELQVTARSHPAVSPSV